MSSLAAAYRSPTSPNGWAGSNSLSDYNVFATRMNALFAALQANRKTSADDVAEVIYDAATDATGRLRYFVGEDVGNLIRAKREMSDEDLVAFMKAWLLPKS